MINFSSLVCCVMLCVILVYLFVLISRGMGDSG